MSEMSQVLSLLKEMNERISAVESSSAELTQENAGLVESNRKLREKNNRPLSMKREALIQSVKDELSATVADLQPKLEKAKAALRQYGPDNVRMADVYSLERKIRKAEKDAAMRIAELERLP